MRHGVAAWVGIQSTHTPPRPPAPAALTLPPTHPISRTLKKGKCPSCQAPGQQATLRTLLDQPDDGLDHAQGAPGAVRCVGLGLGLGLVCDLLFFFWCVCDLLFFGGVKFCFVCDLLFFVYVAFFVFFFIDDGVRLVGLSSSCGWDGVELETD